MTADPPDPIAAAAARYKRDSNKAESSRKELTNLVLDALREPDSKPIDIAKRAEWTPAYVRKLARESGIQADADYKARTAKARARLIAEASTSPAVAGPRQQATQAAPVHVETVLDAAISPSVAAMAGERVKELAEAAEARHPEWIEEIRQAHPTAGELRLHYLIVEAGVRMGFRPRELDEEQSA
jgi:hypothetical protein